MSMQTIHARVHTYVPEHTETVSKRVPVIDSTWFDAHGVPLSGVADRLWEIGIEENCEVGIVLEFVPQGVEVRKPTGETVYVRARDNWFRRTLEITDPRVILVGDEGGLSLEDPKKIFLVELSQLFGCRWEDIDEGLGHMRCPK